MTVQHIHGHGVDLIEIPAFRRLMEAMDPDSLARYFTKAELLDAGYGAVRIERLAGRFATKEAVLKSLGLGWGDGVSFTDVETTTLDSGQPTIVLHRRLAEIAAQRGISTWFVSTTHNAASAMASVIATSQ